MRIKKKEPIKKVKLKARKDDFLRAIQMIKSKDIKNNPLDSLVNKRRKQKLLSLCFHDCTIPNRRRQNNEVLPTNTQLLLSQLRKCISEHNWAAAARCVHYMLDMNGKLLSVIWKSLIVILFNHSNVTAQTLNEFLQMCLGLHSNVDKSEFLETLLTLPKDISIFSRNRIKTEVTSEEEQSYSET
ncbi:hypothetical protein O3M35_001770 [Rhynocoris fuscipes]|uniref:Uncharacterized protein n=1 Tax=Rhynocoris fuscipes TaxID=488301 RepID=A0AAW1CQ42_9HEMI